MIGARHTVTISRYVSTLDSDLTPTGALQTIATVRGAVQAYAGGETLVDDTLGSNTSGHATLPLGTDVRPQDILTADGSSYRVATVRRTALTLRADLVSSSR